MATIDKRAGGWRAQIRKTGFKHQTRTFRTKALAEAWARKLEADMDRGVAPDIGALRAQTVRELFTRFRDEVSPKRKGSCWEIVRINALLGGADFMHMRLDQDISGEIRKWATARVGEVSAASVNRELNLISGVFSHAIKAWGLALQANPVHNVQRPPMPRKGREKTWSDADLQKFRAALGDTLTPPRRVKDYLWPAVELAVESAMRLGEICSIRTADVHLEERWLHLGDTKNGDSRDVPLSSKAVEILRPLVGVAEEYVFPVNKNSLGVEFREVRNAAGLGDLRFHDTRHTAATRLSKKLANVLELSAVTGHRSLQSLKVYYNPKASDLAAKLG
jgi:integrase